MDDIHFNIENHTGNNMSDQAPDKHTSVRISGFGRSSLHSKSPFTKLGNVQPFGNNNSYSGGRELGPTFSSKQYRYGNKRSLDYGKDYSQQPRYASPFSGLALGTTTKDVFKHTNSNSSSSVTQERTKSGLSKNLDSPKLSQDTELKVERDLLSDSAVLTFDTNDTNDSANQIRYIKQNLESSALDMKSMINNAGNHDSLVQAQFARQHSHDDMFRNTAVNDAEGEGENDLSALMFKGATDLRNVRTALAEQVEKNQLLQKRLEKIIEEKKILGQQLEGIKNKATKCAETTSTRLNELNALVLSLKAQTGQYASVAAETGKELQGLTVMKGRIEAAEKQLESLCDDDGAFVPTQAWRLLLGELQLDISNRLQVIDLHRDRLEHAQSELADARNRIVDLEANQCRSNENIQLSSERLLQAESTLSGFIEQIKQRQCENIELVASNAELEAKLNMSEQVLKQTKQQLLDKEDEVRALETLRKELCVAKTIIENSEEQMSTYKENDKRLHEALVMVKDRDLKIELSQASYIQQCESLKAMQDRMVSYEANAAEQTILLQKAKTDLAEKSASLEAELSFRSILVAEKEKIENSLELSKSEAKATLSEIEDLKSKLHETEFQYRACSERFEDLSVRMRMEKNAFAEAQERFMDTEAKLNELLKYEKNTSELRAQQAKAQLDVVNGEAKRYQTELTVLAEKHKQEISVLLSEHSKETQQLKDAFEDKTKEEQELRHLLAEKQNIHQSSLVQNEAVHRELDQLREELKAATKLVNLSEEGMKNATLQFERVQNENEILKQRASSLTSRFERNDLSPEEKRFTEMVDRASHSMHERELVAKGNELRKRENTIKSLEKRLAEIEAQLARVLNKQAEEKTSGVEAAFDGQALIDPVGWMASESQLSDLSSTSTPVAKRKVQDVGATIIRADTLVGGTLTTLCASPERASNTAVARNRLRAQKSNTESMDLDLSKNKENKLIGPSNENPSKRKRKPEVEARPLRRSRTANCQNEASLEEGLSNISRKNTNTDKDVQAIPKVKARKRR